MRKEAKMADIRVFATLLAPEKNATFLYLKQALYLEQAGFFLGVGQKTQGPKNSNSRNFSRKLKHFFSKNSRNRKMLGTFLPYITNISCLCIRFHPKTPKYNVFAVKTQGIFKNSMETQGFFENSRPK